MDIPVVLQVAPLDNSEWLLAVYELLTLQRFGKKSALIVGSSRSLDILDQLDPSPHIILSSTSLAPTVYDSVEL